MIYNESLKKLDIEPTSPFYKELVLMRELSLFSFIPDESKDFNTNLVEFYKRKEKLQAVSKIYEIKKQLYFSIGEVI